MEGPWKVHGRHQLERERARLVYRAPLSLSYSDRYEYIIAHM